jgi:hypothetical protein
LREVCPLPRQDSGRVRAMELFGNTVRVVV